jgi:alkanesulfonate monooxygenase SsuD/methylene tetrahydromethanopterin reductase-like flavin-dependent oxidoreductase (luciferase family)
MKYGLDVSTAGEYFNPRTLADLAAEAEEAGWDGFFLMTPLARRRPWKVARETVSLDHLSNGRLIFGAGLGDLPQGMWSCFLSQ